MKETSEMRHALIVGAVLTCVILAAFRVHSDSPRTHEGPGAQCKISFDNETRLSLEIGIPDPKLVHELVAEPLESAKRDPRPARYEVLGVLSIDDGHGSKEQIALFLPWGHIKRGEVYSVADFTKLRQHIQKTLGAISKRLGGG
jgi:hypothetical protein